MSPRPAQIHNVALFGKPRINDVRVVDEEVLEVMDWATMRLPVDLDGNDSAPDSGFRHAGMERLATTHKVSFPAIRVACPLKRLSSVRENNGSTAAIVSRKLRSATGRSS